MKSPVVVLIRDGWGYRKSKYNNSIAEGETKFTDSLMQNYPNILIDASGESVGLPKGYMGNSEVGHMTIGSGRIMKESLLRINESIKNKSFFSNKEFNLAIDNCIKKGTDLHLLGLIQFEGVHSHLDHLFALLNLCKKKKFNRVKIHAICDGRDSPVKETSKRLKLVLDHLKKLGFGDVVSISGRYYAMDRDKRWKRTKKAYDCIVEGKGEEFSNALKGLKDSYKLGETDEFIKPKKLKGYQGFKDNDSIICFNFRTDRPRQITSAIVENNFKEWTRKIKNVFFVGMTKYYGSMNAKVAFKDITENNLLGEILSKAGKKQLRISETEKYAHVTFFFNGQIEKPYKGEDRIMINSPKVSTYDLKPEMSANKITQNLVREIKKDKYDVIITNIVNGDMVGHTGIKDACLKAAKVVDSCVEKIVKETLKKEGTVLIFADHGNLEDRTLKWRTSHTTNKVPFIVVSNDIIKLKKTGGLKDIAPTVLKILGINKPKDMTGHTLIC